MNRKDGCPSCGFRSFGGLEIFYQKVRDLFVLSSDYDKSDKATQVFFATVQNLLIFAVTQQTAAELITARANPADPHFSRTRPS